MAAAYYSRNNSYSRSHNAEVAESRDRFPLTRAARHLGLSSSAFRAGLLYAGISTDEWHHVGKYANRVDYYDVNDSGEIYNSFSFWKGATTKANKALCLENMKRIAYDNMIEKTNSPYFNPHRYYDRSIISLPQPMTDKAMWRAVRKAIADKNYAAKMEANTFWEIKKRERISLTSDGAILGINRNFPCDLSDYRYSGSSGSGKTHYFVKIN